MYVRHAAWLAATPEKASKSRAESLAGSTMAEMPPVHVAGGLLETLWDMGVVSSGAAGAVPLGDLDIAAWQSNQGVRLTPWECRTIKMLSRQYANQSHDARKRDCPAPFAGIVRDDEAQRQRVDQMFRGLAARYKPKRKR